MKLATIAGIPLIAAVVSMPVMAESIVVMNYANYMPDNLIPDFEKETGINVTLVETPTAEETMGRIVAANGEGYDVVFTSQTYLEALKELGLAAKLDHSKIPNAKNLYPEAEKLAYDVGNQYSMPYSWGIFGLCYRKDLLSYTPDSWWDVLKPKHEASGKVTMFASDRWLMMPAQLALGMSVNDYAPEDLKKVQDVLVTAKKTLLAYDDVTMFSKLASGEAVISQSPDGWCNYGTQENKNVTFKVAKEKSDLWIDVMFVTEASTKKDAAQKFINFVLKPENHKWLTDKLFFKTPNKTAMEMVSPELIKQYPTLGMDVKEFGQFEVLRAPGDAAKKITDLSMSVQSAK